MSSTRCFARLAIPLFVAVALAACKKSADPTQASPSASASASAGLTTDGLPLVLVTDDGFQPSRVPLKKGGKLVFRRTSATTCATEVVFPEHKLEKPLPLNTDVVVELPASATGEVVFQCGMGMYKSQVVISAG